MRPIIGLTGYAGSGKDEAAKALISQLHFTQLSFARPMKDAVLALNPIVSVVAGLRVSDVIEKYGEDVAKRMYPELRALYQRFGTEVGREQFGENFWVDRAMAQVDKLPRYDPVVFTDVRFKNEAHAIYARGGRVIRIERPNVGSVNAHVSDAGINDIPITDVISNSGTIEMLHDKIVLFAKGQFHEIVKQRGLFGE